jgi:hypothetical protein
MGATDTLRSNKVPYFPEETRILQYFSSSLFLRDFCAFRGIYRFWAAAGSASIDSMMTRAPKIPSNV